MTDDRRERHFRMDLRTGRVLNGTPEPPVEEIPDEEWRPIGEIDPMTGPPLQLRGLGVGGWRKPSERTAPRVPLIQSKEKRLEEGERPHEDQIMSLIRTPPISENPPGRHLLGAMWCWIRNRLDAIYNGRW